MVNRRSDLSTRRFSYFGTWESTWVGDSLIYSDLVHQDFKIISFLNGLFKKLSIPTSKFQIVRYLTNFVVIETDLYVVRPFWIVLSHLSPTMESSHFYYFFRLLLRTPRLMYYTNRNQSRYVNLSPTQVRSFYLLLRGKGLKYVQKLQNAEDAFFKNFSSFLDTYPVDPDDEILPTSKTLTFKRAPFQYIKKCIYEYYQWDNYLEARFFKAYDYFYYLMYYVGYEKRVLGYERCKPKAPFEHWSGESIIRGYVNVMMYPQDFKQLALRRNERLRSRLEELQPEFRKLRADYVLRRITVDV